MVDLSLHSGKTIALMGLGKSGLATARRLCDAGAKVLAWDDSEIARQSAMDAGIPISNLMCDDWTEIDHLILSPGIPHTHPKPHAAAVAAKKAGKKIIGDIELLIRANKEARVVAITGTNGKSTTTALIGHILKSAGIETGIGGNLGTPALDLPALNKKGVYVLELSSYQLELTPSLCPQVAVLLNISPDHLDRHGGLEGYIDAKSLIFKNQSVDDTTLIGIDEAIGQGLCDDVKARNEQQVIPLSGHQQAPGGIFAVDRVLYDDRSHRKKPIVSLNGSNNLPGNHNVQNAAAAAGTALTLGLAPNIIADGIRSFPGLAHRQQLAATIDGVRYVNDSKATNIDAAARALHSYKKIYWIAGGLAKEGGLDGLLDKIGAVRHAFLIGEAERQFEIALSDKIPVTCCGKMETAIYAAHKLSHRERLSNAVVLLSPACASWDQYSSFEERGSEFCRLTAQLPGTEREIYWSGDMGGSA